jgi:hypothetical protein
MKKEEKMKKLLSTTALGFAACFLTLAPAWAQNVDDRIQALEEELTKLKAEQKQVQAEQIDLRKEGAAAAAKMPNISRRAGQGVLIEAADKSWSLRTHFRLHLHSLFRDGRSNFDADGNNARPGAGEINARRVRPTWYFCLNDCFYEGEVALDIDGMGGGSGHSSRFNGSDDDDINGALMQRAVAFIHFENIHPWLPTFYFGADSPAGISTYRRGSSNVATQLEYDMLSRNNGFNTGSMGTGYGLDFSNLPVGPGSLNVNYAVGNEGESGDGGAIASDLKDQTLYVHYLPFNKTKNKWLRGLGVEWGGWWCPFDENAFDNGCSDTRAREVEGSQREQMWRGNNEDGGDGFFWMTGLGWRIGPYMLRAVYGRQTYEQSSTKSRIWLIGNELMIWSPKGFLTGSYSTPGTLYGGWHFERFDGRCNDGCANSGQYNNNHILLRQLGVFYVLQPGLNVGLTWHWYDAKKLRVAEQEKLECRNTGVVGRGCDWHNVTLAFRWQF